MAFGIPLAVSVVPSSGSTAMSTSSPSPSLAWRPDLLADVEHRRLVHLALADHHRAADVDGVEGQAHRLHGGAVGGVLVALAHPEARGERCGLRHPHQLQRQVAAHHQARFGLQLRHVRLRSNPIRRFGQPFRPPRHPTPGSQPTSARSGSAPAAPAPLPAPRSAPAPPASKLPRNHAWSAPPAPPRPAPARAGAWLPG